MARRRPTYRQLPLPFDGIDLTQRVRRVLPPGLCELAEAEKLSDEEVRQLAEVWHTIRGKKPTTLDEWQKFAAMLKRVLGEELKAFYD